MCADRGEVPAIGRASARWSGPAAAACLALLLAACAAPVPPPSALAQSAATTAQSAQRAWARGDLALARTLYERALANAEAVEDFALAGATLLNLALVQSRAGDAAGAMARVERLLAAPQRYGAALHAAAATRKALLLLDVPDANAALEWAGRAEAACAAPCAQAAAIANLRAFVAWQRGDAALAARHAETAQAAAAAAGQPAEQANALRQLARSRSHAGQHEQAAADAALALAIDQRLGLPERIALDLVAAAEVELQRQRPSAAREFLERALAVSQAAGLTQGADALRRRLAGLGVAR